MHVRKDPEAEQHRAASEEIARIQELFEINRDLGIHTSPYPQIGFSSVLGCAVREVRRKDMIR